MSKTSNANDTVMTDTTYHILQKQLGLKLNAVLITKCVSHLAEGIAPKNIATFSSNTAEVPTGFQGTNKNRLHLKGVISYHLYSTVIEVYVILYDIQ